MYNIIFLLYGMAEHGVGDGTTDYDGVRDYP
jgi:hypothetical protein